MRRRKFSPYGKPYRPDKPKEFLSLPHVLCSLDFAESGWYHSRIKITDEIRDCIQQATHVELHYEDDYEIGKEARIDFLTEKEVKNPRYEDQLVAYEREYAVYKEELAWWKAEKVKYDAKEAEKKEAAERKQLERLQKKYRTEP